jgi:hypothetical protein
MTFIPYSWSNRCGLVKLHVGVGLMSVLSWIMIISAVSFGATSLVVLAHGILNSARFVTNAFANGRSPTDWWMLAAVVPVAIVLVIGVASYLEMRIPVEAYLGIAGAIAIPISWMIVPSTLLILRAYYMHGFSWAPYAYAVLALFSMPFSLMMTIPLTTVIYDSTSDSSPWIGDRLQAQFKIETDDRNCTTAVMHTLGIEPFRSLDQVFESDTNWISALMQVSANTTADSMLLGMPADFGCALTNLYHNPNDPVISVIFFVFKWFVSSIAVAVLVLPVGVFLLRRK